MSTHNIGFDEDFSIIIKYHQICTLSLLLIIIQHMNLYGLYYKLRKALNRLKTKDTALMEKIWL